MHFSIRREVGIYYHRLCNILLHLSILSLTRRDV